MTEITPLILAFWCVVAFILVLLALLLFTRSWFPLYQLDLPNNRSLHTEPVLLGGGVAIWLVVIALYLLSKQILGLDFLMKWRVVVGSIILLLVSTIDDFKDMPVKPRLAIQCLVITYFIRGAGLFPVELLPGVLVHIPIFAQELLEILFVIWTTNLFNFMDGIDGLAGGVAVIGFGFICAASIMTGVFPLALFCVIIIGSYLGFLFWNLPPAKLFMGDAGSIPLGFVVAAVALIGARQCVLPIWASIGVFAPFFSDATITLLRRLFAGEKIWEPHRKHYYQRLVLAGYSQRQVLAIYLILSLICGLISLAVFQASTSVARIGIGAVIFIIVCSGSYIELKVSSIKFRS